LKSNPDLVSAATAEEEKAEDATKYRELYIWQILNGDPSIGLTKGLLPLCHEYMALKQWPDDQVQQISRYLQFLADRATGEVPTGATFLRSLALEHPQYAHDSKLTPQICYGILSACASLNQPGDQGRARLLGKYA
jgi:glutamate--cysteine ligase catalytic subunit